MVRRLPAQPLGQGPWSFDFPGLLFFVAFIVPALLLLEKVQGANWASAPTFVGLALVSGVSLSLLLRRERRLEYPLIPVGLLRKAAIWRSDALAACHGAALVSLITFVPIYLRVVRGTSASETGLLLLPVAIGIGAGSLTTGRLVSKTGRTMIYPSVALLLGTGVMAAFAVGLGWLSLIHIAAVLALEAFFMGSVMGVVQVTVQNAAGSAMLGAAAGSVNFSRAVGASFGTTLVAVTLFSVLAAQAPEGRQYFGSLIELGPSVLDQVVPATRTVIMLAMASTFRIVFLLIAGFLGVGAILAWSVPARCVP
jgi:MFS family permease